MSPGFQTMAENMYKALAKVGLPNSGGNSTQMTSFLNYVEIEENHDSVEPFTKYRVGENSQYFWMKCGANIKCLELYYIKFLNVDDFRNVVFNECPNMKQLVLRSITVEGMKNSAPSTTEYAVPHGEHSNLKSLKVIDSEGIFLFPVSWMELLSHFANLEAFSIEGRTFNFDDIFKAIILIRQQNPNKLRIRHIDTSKAYDAHSRLILTLPAFKMVTKDPTLILESLKISLCTHSVFGTTVHLCRILNSHTDSLKSLCIHGEANVLHPKEDLSYSKLNILENLEELEIGSNAIALLSLLKFCPNVRKLILNPRFSNNYSILMKETSHWEMLPFILRKFKELEIPTYLEIEVIEKLTKFFPKVEKLKMAYLQDNSFAVICTGWHNLKELVLESSGVSDVGFTGLDLEDVEKINAAKQDGSWRPVTVPRANITALKESGFSILDLKSLSVDTHISYAKSPEYNIGYCGLIHGIYQLQSLQHLKINLCHIPTIIRTHLAMKYKLP